jgi:prolyl oligopeptidase
MRYSCFVLLLVAPAILMAEQPPAAPVKTVVDTHFGTQVTDHYRYMEDFQNPAVQAWVKQQAEHAERTLATIPGREKLLARIKELDAGRPYTLFDISRHPSGQLFYFKQLASENVAKLYVRAGLAGEEKLLIDPEQFPRPAEGGHFSLSFYRVSPSGQQLLYGFAASGSEQTTLRVFDRNTGRDLPESIDRLESDYVPPYWLPDGKSFVYSRRRQLPADAPAADGYKFTQSFLHRLGTSVAEDKLVFAAGADGSPAMQEMDFPAVIIPVGSKWAIGQIKHGDETDLTLYTTRSETLGQPDVRWTKICDRADQVTEYAVHGDDIYLLTAHEAPRFKAVRTSLARPDFASAETIVPAGDNVVDSLTVAQDALYVGVLAGVPNIIQRVPYEAGAKIELLNLPAGEPAATVISARADLPGVLRDAIVDARGEDLCLRSRRRTDRYEVAPRRQVRRARVAYLDRGDGHQPRRCEGAPLDPPSPRHSTRRLAPHAAQWLRGVRLQRFDALQAHRSGLAGAWWRTGHCPCARRRSVWQRMAPRGTQADQAEHLAGLPGLCSVPGRSKIHLARQAGRRRRERGRHSYWSLDHRATRLVCRGPY